MPLCNGYAIRVRQRCQVRATVLVLVVAGLFLAAAARAQPAPKTLLFLGDSLTEGYGVDPEAAFPAQVGRLIRERLGREDTILNAGVSGSTTASGLSRLHWYAKRKPDILFLALGANDGLRGVDVAASKNALTEIVAAAKGYGMQVVVAGMQLPPNYGPDYRQAFAAMFGEVAKAHGVHLMPFLLEGVAGVRDYNLPDGIHPNAAGYRVIAANVYAVLEPLLSSSH